MGNHLIIGLGGTGGKIIRAFRKTVYQQFRTDAPAGIYLGYLYLDSSREMMDLNDPAWKVLGHSVQLGRNSQFKISGADLKTILENINNFPGIRPWIGNRDQWKEILDGIVGEALGGQKRRLGRFLLANYITDLRSRLQQLVTDLQNSSGQARTTFHICTGLAGGTGAGTVIDLVAQIRNCGFTDLDTYRVVLYTLLPDENPPQGWNTGNYHANGYAALMELNALSIKALNPFDLLGRDGRLSFNNPFNGCYLFTNRNENGMAVDVDTVVPEIVSDFLYQKIITVRHVQTWPAQLQSIENAENGDGTPEAAPGTGDPARSKRFLTFGIKRLAVPEEEIREYMTYTFTAQAALQFLYNNWNDGVGFVEEPKNIDFKEQVQQPDIQNRWRMKDEHICLSQGILEADANNPKWKPIPVDWQEFITHLKRTIRENVDAKQWLDQLEKGCQDRFNESYRTNGVAKFYETKTRAKKEMAQEIRRLAESELFDEWRTGRRSMYEISRLVEDLIDITEERSKRADDKQAKMERRAEKANERIKGVKGEWANLSWLSAAIFKKRDKLFDAMAVHLQEYYIARTMETAWGFGKRLLEELKESLIDLKSQVDISFSRIREAHRQFVREVNARCNDSDNQDLKPYLIRFYRPDLVKRITKRFLADEAIQQQQASGVRSHLVNILGETQSFEQFNRHITAMRFKDALETKCQEYVIQQHDLQIQNAQERLLGVNIIERLQNQFGGDYQELRTFIYDLVSYAGNYVSFNQTEVNKTGQGIPAAPTRMNKFTVILPRSPDHAEFMGSLQQALQESRAGDVDIIQTDGNANEIILISITNLFPLRFLEPVKGLKKRYQQRIKDLGRERAALEIHTEGDGTNWPDLFVETQQGVEDRVIPYLLIAKALGILQQRTHTITGAPVWSLITKDEDGFDQDFEDLGETPAQILERIDVSVANNIQNQAEQKLKTSEYRHRERQKSLIATIAEDMETMKAERGMDDPLYRRFLAGAKSASQIIKSEG